MQKVKYYQCPGCDRKYNSLQTWSNHMKKEHSELIPDDMTMMQYFYFLQTGKRGNKCIVCKSPTNWNEGTGKYERFCPDPECKQKYREMFKKRMINKYGKATLLDDPEQQRKMLEGKKNHGVVSFPDGVRIGYNSSYEKDFFEMLRDFIHCNGSDIMSPSPHTYYYDYKNQNDTEHEGRKFYIPDAFIPSLNLEIEIKQNTSTHPKILAIDKVKEAQKDEVMRNMPGFRYIKITDKDYSEFFDLLLELKESFPSRKEIATEGFVAINTSPRNWDDIIRQMIEFQSKLANYTYGYLYKGQIKKSMANFVEEYRTQTPDEFGRSKVGVCWDFTAYEYHTALKTYNLAGKCYYVMLLNDPYGMKPSHTFFIIPGTKNLYIEASYGKMAGVWTFNSLDDVVSVVVKQIANDYYVKNPRFMCFEYTPGKDLYNVDCEEFMGMITSIPDHEVPIKYNPNARITRLGGATPVEESIVPDYRCSQLYDYDNISTEAFLDFFFKKESPKEVIEKWLDKLFDSEMKSLVGGTPHRSRYITPEKVLVDNKLNIISIQNIKILVLISRIRETFGEKRLDYIFDRTYKSSDITAFNKKRMSRSQMRITSLTTPTFFALELVIIFKELYRAYRDPTYARLAKDIYNKTWLSKADSAKVSGINLGRLKNINPAYTLKPHQKKFIESYPQLKAQLNLRGYYLAFDQGLGKTLTAAALSEVLAVDRVYIVCPKTLCTIWEDELRQYFASRYRSHLCTNKNNCNTPSQVKFFIVNNESIKNMHPFVDLPGQKMLIVDEAHNFRSWGGGRVKDLIDLADKINPSDILPMSGTPIKAIPSEIVPILKLLDPLFDDHAADIYNSCFKFDSYLAMDIIKDRFGKVLYRKTKAEINAESDRPMLPNKTIDEIRVKVPNSDRFLMRNIKMEVRMLFTDIYAQMMEDDTEKRARLEEIVNTYSSAGLRDTNHYLRMMLKITDRDGSTDYHELDQVFFDTFLDKYVVTNPRISKKTIDEVKDLERTFIRLRNSAMGKAIGQIYPPRRNILFISLFDQYKDQIEKMILDCPKKTVIFSQLLPVVHHIAEVLNKDGIGTVMIVGGMSNRKDVINQFKTDPNIKVIIATSQTMGTGVTLVEANQMFFFGPPWRSTDYDQCCDRIYRIGQDTDVTIYNVRLDTEEKNLSDRMDQIMEWSSRMFHTAIDNEEIAMESYDYDEVVEYDDIPDEVTDEEFVAEAYEYFDLWTNALREYDDSVEDAAIEAAGYSKENNQPVFIILTIGHSLLASIIRRFTGDTFSHSSIAFDISLNPMYSFDTNKLGPHREMGFVRTYPTSDNWDPSVPTPYSIYTTFISEENKQKMLKRLEFLIKNFSNLQYSFVGLLRVFFHIKSPKRMKWFCSQFVAEILAAGRGMDRDSSLYRPQEFTDVTDVEFVIKGDNIGDYDPKTAQRELNRIKKLSSPQITLEALNEVSTVSDEEFVMELSDYFAPYRDAMETYQNLELEEIALEGAGYSRVNNKPVFIILSKGYTTFARLILALTQDPFSHAMISFDISLDPTYTFGLRKRFNDPFKLPDLREIGFTKTNPTDHAWGNHPDAYAVFVTYVSERDLEKMKMRLEHFIQNQKQMKYSFFNCFKCLIHMQSDHRMKWFCSAFVAEILSAGKSLEKDATLYRPADLQNLSNVEFVIGGDNINDYNPEEARKALERIRTKPTPTLAAEARSCPHPVLYHGSNKSVDILLTHISTHGEAAVYASPMRNFALFYCGKPWDDLSINQTIHNGEIYLTEIRPGAFKDCFDCPGFMYTITDTDGFTRVSKDSDKEYWSKKDIVFSDVEYIPNVAKEIWNSDIKVYLFPRLPSFIKDHDTYRQKTKAAFAFYDKLKIVNSLPRQEQLQLTRDGNFIKSPYIIYSEVAYRNDEPAGFIEVCQFEYNPRSHPSAKNPYPHKAYVTIATASKYRGEGIASGLVQNCIKYFTDRHSTNALIWKVHKNNKASIKLAKKMKFRKWRSDSTSHYYAYAIVPNVFENQSNWNAQSRWGNFTLEDASSAIDQVATESAVKLGTTRGYYQDGRWNSLLESHGKKYRERCEVLVIRDRKVFLAIDWNGDYQIPGGSTEPGKSMSAQAIRECEEEANFTPKNLKYVLTYQYTWDNDHPRPKYLDTLPKEKQWDGCDTSVFVAEYDKPYRNYIDPRDVDLTIKNGTWIPIQLAWEYLNPEHQAAIQFAMGSRNMQRKLGIAEESVFARKLDFEDSPARPFEKYRMAVMLSNDLDHATKNIVVSSDFKPDSTSLVIRYIKMRDALDYCGNDGVIPKDEVEQVVFRSLDKLTEDDSIGELYHNTIDGCNKYLASHEGECIVILLDSFYHYFLAFGLPAIRVDEGLIPRITRRVRLSPKSTVSEMRNLIEEDKAFRLLSNDLRGKGRQLKESEVRKLTLYHVSAQDLTHLEPRPSATSADNENVGIPRISASTSVDRCFSAISFPDGMQQFYVYKLILSPGTRVFKPNRLAVPDVDRTDEHWVLDKVSVIKDKKIVYRVVLNNHKTVYYIESGETVPVTMGNAKKTGEIVVTAARDNVIMIHLKVDRKPIASAVIDFKARQVKLPPRHSTGFKVLSEYISKRTGWNLAPAQESGMLVKSSFGGFTRKELTPELIDHYKSKENMLIHCRTSPDVRGAMFFKDDEVVAYVAVEDNTIVALWVHPQYRHNGYGSKLLNIASNSYGAEELSVNRGNLNAIKLYRDHGWYIAKATKYMYFMRPKAVE